MAKPLTPKQTTKQTTSHIMLQATDIWINAVFSLWNVHVYNTHRLVFHRGEEALKLFEIYS
ncbi:MAG TPA: hypothetical protein GXX37_15610 [Clostridiaceae bacterium]|nr:hypothetical protein [Clostridiaceae bacterium]